MTPREQNERKFGDWEDLPHGGRRYFRDYLGRRGGCARYLKEVDAHETTMRFAQEIYNREGRVVAVHEKFPCRFRTSRVVGFEAMKVTREIVAQKLAAYLRGEVDQAALVDWAERTMADGEFDEADNELLSEIVGRLGLADVAEFGLRWQDCEEFLRQLGYRATVTVSHA